MKNKILAVGAVLAASIGAVQAAPLSDPLSPGKPLSVEEVQKAGPQATPLPGRATYTYLRCYYRLDPAAGKPQTSYVWATDPSSGDYYRLPGYWWSGKSLALRNMFYSDVSQPALTSVCLQTLSKQNIRKPLALVAAANNALSYNHAVWSMDSAAQPAGINKLIVFGDSLSDTQNMYGASQWKLPTAKSWYLGRFSNGRVWVEYLAEQLQLPSYNWAIGGSAADQHLVVPGLKQQVDSWAEYMQKAPAYRPENTLFTMLIGGNDLLNYGRSVDQVISDQRLALEKVIAHGGRNIVVLNLPDLSRTPAGSTSGKAGQLQQQVNDYNTRLALLVTQLRQQHGSSLKLNLFDTRAMFDDLLDHPAKYQVSNTSQSCLNIAANAGLPYVWQQQLRQECSNPDAYVFWDNLHPTTHTHLLLGSFVARFAQGLYRLPTLLAARR